MGNPSRARRAERRRQERAAAEKPIPGKRLEVPPHIAALTVENVCARCNRTFTDTTVWPAGTICLSCE